MFPCPKSGRDGDCGQDHKACNGHTKAGRPCRANPPAGATVCGVHGLNGAALEKARQREIERKARLQLPDTVDPMDNPLRVLLETATRCELFMRAVEVKVAELEGRIRFTDDKGSEQLRSEVAVYERALDRLAKVTEGIVRLGIEDRIASVEARKLDLRSGQVSLLVQQVLLAFGHDPDDPAVAGVVLGVMERLWGDE